MFHYYSYFTISVSFRCLTFESFLNKLTCVWFYWVFKNILFSFELCIIIWLTCFSCHMREYPFYVAFIPRLLEIYMYITCFGMAVGWLFKMYIVFGEITQSEWADLGLWKRRGRGTQDFSWLLQLHYGGKCNTAYCNLCRPRIVALYLQSNGFVSVQAQTSIVFFRWYIFNIWNISVTTRRFDILKILCGCQNHSGYTLQIRFFWQIRPGESFIKVYKQVHLKYEKQTL